MNGRSVRVELEVASGCFLMARRRNDSWQPISESVDVNCYRTGGLIIEPEGVDFVIGQTVTDREALLDIADWLNAYRREHDQSEERQNALQITRAAAERPHSKLTKHRPD